MCQCHRLQCEFYLYCSGQQMPCNKEQYVEVECPEDPEVVQELCKQVMKGALFRFLQVEIHVSNDSKGRFSEFCPFLLWIPFQKEMFPSPRKRTRKELGEIQFWELKSFWASSTNWENPLCGSLKKSVRQDAMATTTQP